MRGWFRLWLILSLIAVPALAVWQVHDWMSNWDRINANAVRVCVDAESLGDHPDALTCVHNFGADQTAFAQDHTTPTAVWSQALGFGLIVDLAVSALLAVAFGAYCWVARGFRISN